MKKTNFKPLQKQKEKNDTELLYYQRFSTFLHRGSINLLIVISWLNDNAFHTEKILKYLMYKIYLINLQCLPFFHKRMSRHIFFCLWLKISWICIKALPWNKFVALIASALLRWWFSSRVQHYPMLPAPPISPENCCFLLPHFNVFTKNHKNMWITSAKHSMM